MSDVSCNHDERYKGTFGCKNGCVACELEKTARDIAGLRSEIDKLRDYQRAFECLKEVCGEKQADRNTDAFINVWMKLKKENDSLISEAEKAAYIKGWEGSREACKQEAHKVYQVCIGMLMHGTSCAEHMANTAQEIRERIIALNRESNG